MVLTYRNGLFYLRTAYKEADLLIASEKISAINSGLASFIKERASIQRFLEKHPEFVYSLEPMEIEKTAPPAIILSAKSSKKAGVGPMASLPGALADLALEAMVKDGAEAAIVENGGEVSIKMNREVTVGVYTGKEFNFGLIVNDPGRRIGVSTSSSNVSHALSFGDAYATVVVAENAALADAVSTRVGNVIKSECRETLEDAVRLALSIEGVQGCVVYSGGLISFGGCVKPIALRSKSEEILGEVMLKKPFILSLFSGATN
jgi:ApbE superfamily uncharacterized protein (UPF0280 family)